MSFKLCCVLHYHVPWTHCHVRENTKHGKYLGRPEPDLRKAGVYDLPKRVISFQCPRVIKFLILNLKGSKGLCINNPFISIGRNVLIGPFCTLSDEQTLKIYFIFWDHLLKGHYYTSPRGLVNWNFIYPCLLKTD